MSSLADLRPGDIGFGPLNGAGAKLLVDAGQLMLGEGFRVGRLNIEHVFVVTGVSPGLIPLDENWPHSATMPIVTAIEAMPSGAREIGISDRWTPEYVYVRLPEDYPGQGEDAAAIARAMIGTPYSWLSYVALAAWKFGRKPPRAAGPGMAKLEAWIDRRRPEQIIDKPTGVVAAVALPREAICSVLADQAWALTGKQVMPEGTQRQASRQALWPGISVRRSARGGSGYGRVEFRHLRRRRRSSRVRGAGPRGRHEVLSRGRRNRVSQLGPAAAVDRLADQAYRRCDLVTITEWFMIGVLVLAVVLVCVAAGAYYGKRPQYPPIGSVRGSIEAEPDSRYRPHAHSEDVGGSTVRLAKFPARIFPDGSQPQQMNGSDSMAWKARNQKN